MTELISASPAVFIGIVFAFALVIGSFLNVVIYRLPIPREFCLNEEDARLIAGGGGWSVDFADSLAPNGFEEMEQTDGALDRLISARRLELLTLMRSESAAVFFGVNEKGRLGVHVDASLMMRPAQ